MESAGRVIDWTYDAVYRLIGESIADPVHGNSTSTWTYDKVGNRLTENHNGVVKTFTYDNNDRLLSDGAATYIYDANGSMTARNSAAGNSTYVYDLAGRLSHVGGPAIIDYEYDDAGIRTKKTVNTTDVTKYLVDTSVENARVLVETDALNAVRATYVYGDDLLSMQRATTPSFYLFDGQMSTRQLTDALQAVTDTYDFDAFGNVSNRTGTTQNDYLYTGEQFDANVGFYYLRARYYDPATGRFTSQDAFGGNPFEPMTLHKYAYANNNPINAHDPSGNFTLIEQETAIEIAQVIARITPTLLRGFIIYKGIDVFYRPGFEMRNWGIEMLSFCASDQCFEAAVKLIESGNRLIVAGSHMIDWGEKVVGQVEAIQGLLKTGYGIYELMQAIKNAPVTVRAFWVNYQSISRLEYLAVQGESLLHVTATTQIKLVYIHMEKWTDYTEVIHKAIELLKHLRKVPGELHEVWDMIHGEAPEL